MSTPGTKPSLQGQAGAVVAPAGVAGALPIAPPDDLSPEGRDAWTILLPDLIESQVFRTSDVLMVRELCEMLGQAKAFRDELGRLQPQLDEMDRQAMSAAESDEDRERAAKVAEYLSGRIKRARSGYLGYMKQAQSLAAEFGVSPVSRVRLGIMRLQGNSLLSALGADDGG